MDDECIFKFRNSCPHNEKLQTSQSGGDRLQNIMDASRILGDNVLSELETKLVDDPLHQAQYHKKCVSLYLLNAKRTSDKEKRAGSESSPVPKKRTRSSVGPPFDWLHQCFYCSGQCMLEPDPKNPNRWNPAYLVRETEKKETGDEKTDPIEIRIRAKCHERADDWANDILDRLSGLTVRAADLHAADARYHRDCYARFFSGRSPSGETKTVVPPDLHLSAIETLASEIESDRSHMWDSVALMNRYLELGGKPLRRSMLIHLISEKVKDLVLLSAPGYRSILFFRDNTSATLKMIKDDGDDNLDAAINVVAKSIKKECSEIQYEHRTYTTKICKESAEEYVSDTIQQLLSKLSLDKQSLPSLLIGNMITSALKKHPTPLQIALGVYLHRRKIVMHMHDYLITCSYDELLRFKKSAAVAKYHDICSERRSPVKEDGLVQVVVDNFDAELSSPNGKISTHAMATIEAHSKPPAQPVPVTIPRISKTEMSSPISPEEEDELIAYIGTEKPSPPTLASHDLPSEYFEAQRVSYERAADMDFQFLKVVKKRHRHGRRGKMGQGGMLRRNRGRTEDQENISLGDVHELYEVSDKSADIKVSESATSFGDILGDFTADDDFQREVARKSQALFIGRQDAEIEVFLDKLTEKHGTTDKVLLYIISNMTLESKIQVLINTLIHRGANTSARDSDGKTPLHHAVERGFKGVVAKLLENDALPHVKDKADNLPFEIAKANGNDDICALLLAYMPNRLVRDLFIGSGTRECEVSFHNLLKGELQQTVLSVLDCMLEHGGADGVKVYYNILESDESGRPPDDPLFNADQKSPLQLIAKMGEKCIVYHDAVRLLLRRKWKHFARSRFQINSFINIMTLVALTFSAVVAVMTLDPTTYDSPLQIARAVTEIISYTMACITLLTELNQLRRHRLEYFHDLFNWMDFSSSSLIICVLPIRYAHNNAQWHVFAFGYLFWCIRMFKFAAVFRHIGVYAQVLFRTLAHDLVQFIVVFLVILLAFSGSFLLSLRGDSDLDTHSETSTFWGILFVGLRILTEAQPVVEYTGDDGYRVVSAMFMIGFVFTCLVILLNILIAQLSDTYQKVQQDAQRGLEVNRAWIVARVELNSFFFGKNFRRQYYKEWEAIPDLKHTLTKWDSPPLNEMNKYVHDIWDSLDNHKMNLLTIRHRLARQEHALCKMQDQLSFLVSHVTDQQTGQPQTQRNILPHGRPRFGRTDSELGSVEENDITREKINRKLIRDLDRVDGEHSDANEIVDTNVGNHLSSSSDSDSSTTGRKLAPD